MREEERRRSLSGFSDLRNERLRRRRVGAEAEAEARE